MTATEVKAIPFNWDLYQTGEYKLMTRDMRYELLKAFSYGDPDSLEYPYTVILMDTPEGTSDQGHYIVTKDGHYYSGREYKYDVVMVKKEPKTPVEYELDPSMVTKFFNIDLAPMYPSSAGKVSLYLSRSFVSLPNAMDATTKDTIATINVIDIPAVREVLIERGILKVKS